MGVTKPLSQLNPGQRLGPYTIDRLIGRGRHSEVYRASRAGTPDQVALKVFLPGVIRGPSHAASFLKEMPAIAALTHPNIVSILDYGCDSARDLCYIAMECFDSTTLRDDITTHPNGYSRAELWGVFEPVADALAYAHDKGRVHGSVRPDHIFLAEDRRPVLSDFSLASVSGEGESGRAAPLGAAAYWAPEQAAQVTPGPAADVYALGIMLYELAVGDVPFKARTRDALVAQHLYDAPVPPGQRRAGLDPRIERAILIALHKNPAERFLSVREMLAIMNSTGADDYATLKMDKQLAKEVRRRSGDNLVRVPRPEPPVPEPFPVSDTTTAGDSASRRWLWVIVGIVLAAALLALVLI